jgi:hypothetical protein
VILLSAAISLVAAPAALATDTGGIGPTGTGTGTTTTTSGTPGRARIVDGRAIAPPDAPRRVRDAIAAGNRIRNKPYKWGGGHGSWNDSGYDCSGSVSYVLHGAGMLSRPLASGALMSWRGKGKGRWITVAANRGHAYIVVAGIRMDTSGTGGKGPRWQKPAFTSTNGPFRFRHYNSNF